MDCALAAVHDRSVDVGSCIAGSGHRTWSDPTASVRLCSANCPSLCTLATRPRKWALAGVLDGARRIAERELLDLGDDPIELIVGWSALAQGGTEIDPVQ